MVEPTRRLAIVTPFFPPFVGGAEMVAGKISDILVQHGHSVEVHTLRHDASLPHHELLNSGVNVHRYDYVVVRRFGFTDIQSPSLVDATQNIVADAVHVHSVTFPRLLTRVLSMLHKRDIPTLIVTHGIVEALEGEHHGIRRLAYGIVMPWMLRALFRQVSGTALLSTFDRDILGTRRIAISTYKIVGNGVDLPANLDDTHIDSDRLDVIHVASIKPNKAHLIALEALKFVATPVTYHIVGSGGDLWKSFEESVDAAIAEVPERHRVIKHGRVNDEAKEALYRASDVVIVPSFSETLPLSVLEGMSYGKPVIATNVGGIPQLIRDGETGILIRPNDPQDLGTALTRLVDGALRRALGNSSRDLVAKGYTWDKVASRYEELTTMVIGLNQREVATTD